MNFSQHFHQATKRHRPMILTKSFGWVLAMALLATLAACDTNSTPDVAGTYTGDYWMRYTVADGYAESSGIFSLSVEQSGSKVRISGSGYYLPDGFLGRIRSVTGDLNESGILENISVDAGQAGFAGSDSYEDAVCGTMTGIQSRTTMAFSGNQMRWQSTLSSEHCGRINSTADLSRGS